MKTMPKVNHEEIINALLKSRLLQQKQSVIKLATLLKENWDAIKTEHIITWMELFDAVEDLRCTLDNLETEEMQKSRVFHYEMEEILQILKMRFQDLQDDCHYLLSQTVIPHAA